jgi:hypothetical protein
MIGRIYKIVHLKSDICYVGMTTTNLEKRWTCHKCDYNKNNRSRATIYKYMQEYGIDEFEMHLIKEYEVIDKQHLKVYETLWMRKLKSINGKQSFNPFAVTNFGMKEYYSKNKERIKARVRDYASKNKELIQEGKKKYREKNKEELARKKSIQFTCECGGTWTKGSGFPRHEKTQKHQAYLLIN